MTRAESESRVVVYVDADIEDIIPAFLENRHSDVRAVVEASERGDYETVRVLGHRMKGSGGGYGFDAITDIGRSLEQAANKRNSLEVRHLAQKLASYLACVEIAYA